MEKLVEEPLASQKYELQSTTEGAVAELRMHAAVLEDELASLFRHTRTPNDIEFRELSDRTEKARKEFKGLMDEVNKILFDKK